MTSICKERQEKYKKNLQSNLRVYFNIKKPEFLNANLFIINKIIAARREAYQNFCVSNASHTDSTDSGGNYKHFKELKNFKILALR